MASSFLAAVRDAVAGPANPIPQSDNADGEATGATAPLNREDMSMSTNDTPAGGDKKTGISQAEHDAAVKAATDAGEAKAKAREDRLLSALGTDGVKGDAVRMAAALDLAVKSPSMSGEDVAAFVVANVAAGKPADADASAYEQQRLAAAGPAQPQPAGGRKISIDRSAIYAKRRQPQEG